MRTDRYKTNGEMRFTDSERLTAKYVEVFIHEIRPNH